MECQGAGLTPTDAHHDGALGGLRMPTWRSHQGSEPKLQVQGHRAVFHWKEVQLLQAWTFLRGFQALITHFQEITCSVEETTVCFESGYTKAGPEKRCGVRREPANTIAPTRVTAVLGSKLVFSELTSFRPGVAYVRVPRSGALICNCPTESSAGPDGRRWRRAIRRKERVKRRTEGERGGEAERERKEDKEIKKETIRNLVLCKNQNLLSSQHLQFEGTLISALFISEQWIRWQVD